MIYEQAIILAAAEVRCPLLCFSCWIRWRNSCVWVHLCTVHLTFWRLHKFLRFKVFFSPYEGFVMWLQLYAHLVTTVDSKDFLNRIKEFQQASINGAGNEFPFREATGFEKLLFSSSDLCVDIFWDFFYPCYQLVVNFGLLSRSWYAVCWIPNQCWPWRTQLVGMGYRWDGPEQCWRVERNWWREVCHHQWGTRGGWSCQLYG